MGEYTQYMSDQLEAISPEDEDYYERLINIAGTFRSFGEAMTEFIRKHGYTDEKENIKAKINFVKERFDQEEIQIENRSIKSWFGKVSKIEKETAYQICFAFKLNIEESNDFFRRICLMRGFDCHYVREAVYYYCLANHLSYKTACEIIEKAPDDDKGNIDYHMDILYTDAIVNEINKFKSQEELIKYFWDNEAQFGYNNARAYDTINTLWKKIEEASSKENFELLKMSVDLDKKRSVWDIYLQMLGLDDDEYISLNKENSNDTEAHMCFDEKRANTVRKSLYVIDADRTINPILKNNRMLHRLAADSFPDRQAIEQIVKKGKHRSDESVRKTLILLGFYYFWADKAIREKDALYSAGMHDGERFVSMMDRMLSEAGYPSLYIGNPYDWLFLFAAQDEYPLPTFREFMQELYNVKKDDLNTNYEIED